MLNVIFYSDINGKSEVMDCLEDLRVKSESGNKSARINREKIMAYISALSMYGLRLGAPYIKHIDGEIWELRPIKNRILFFIWKKDEIILLSHFVKKTRKTPKREIEKAQRRANDWIERYGK